MLLSTNSQSMNGDPERRMAHRSELKRRLAENAVRRSRIDELRAIVGKLQSDTDIAADQHSEQTGRLQAELKAIDQRHIDCVLAGTSLDPESVKRRGEILAEIVTLNSVLEQRVDANKRSIAPLAKQITALSVENADDGVLQDRLRQLASPDLQQRLAFSSAMIEAIRRQIRETAGTMHNVQRNIEICQLNRDPTRERLFLDQHHAGQATIASLQGELQRWESESVRLQSEALDE